jgi:putative PIG3 family NAD(P)H quinone oxidoreductase
MKAIVISKPGGLDSLIEKSVPDPISGPDDLIVAVQAAGLNRADIIQRMGNYPQPGIKPDFEIPGLEYAGEVVQIGNRVEDFKIGDHVMGLLSGGGYAEFVSTPARLAIHRPQELSWHKAGGTPEVYITAHDALSQCQLVAGETVLVHACGSGVGVAAIQIAKTMGASLVIGTSNSDEKLKQAQALGLDEGINPTQENFAEKIMDVTNGYGVDVILDVIGANYWEQNFQSLAINGRIILVGLMGGAVVPKANIGGLLQKRARIIGTTLRARPLEQKILATRAFEKSVLPHIKNKSIDIVVDKTFPLREAAKAQQYMEENGNFGKIVLEINA